jgi:hypothetical protein
MIRPIKQVHIDTIRPGDVVLCPDNKERTVCKKDITWDSFLGTRIFGDCYKLGRKLVTKVIYQRALPNFPVV